MGKSEATMKVEITVEYQTTVTLDVPNEWDKWDHEDRRAWCAFKAIEIKKDQLEWSSTYVTDEDNNEMYEWG